MIHNLWNSGNFIFELSQKIHFLSNSTIFTPNSIHKIFTTISTFLCNFHSFKSLTRLLYTSYKTNRTVPTVFHILEQYLGLEKVRLKKRHMHSKLARFSSPMLIQKRPSKLFRSKTVQFSPKMATQISQNPVVSQILTSLLSWHWKRFLRIKLENLQMDIFEDFETLKSFLKSRIFWKSGKIT